MRKVLSGYPFESWLGNIDQKIYTSTNVCIFSESILQGLIIIALVGLRIHTAMQQ